MTKSSKDLSIVDLVVDMIHASVANSKEFGRRAIGTCPFCNNLIIRTFIASDKDGKYSCFSCGESGDAKDFLVKAFGFTDDEAKDMLNSILGAKSHFTEKSKIHNKLLTDANKAAANFYYTNLIEGKDEGSRKAYEYLKSRGLTDATIKSFGLGYSRYGVCGHLKKEGISTDSLVECGLGKIDNDKVKDKMFNRVMFPIVEKTSEGSVVVGFGGRLMDYPDPKFPNAPKYLNTQTTPVFDKKSFLYAWNYVCNSRRKGVILSEGYMDVISLHQAGFDNATATLGTAFTRYHAMMIRKRTDTVYICYDSDDAGVTAKLRAIPILRAEGLKVRILSCYPYKDPDELIRKKGPEAFEKVLQRSMDSYDYVILQMKEKAESEEKFNKEFAHMIVDLPKNDFKCFVDAYNRMRKKDNAEDDSVEDVYSNILNDYKLKF